MSNEKLLQLLEKAYVAELETIINYLSHSARLETFDGHDIGEELRQDVKNEQQHAQELAERIKILGGDPPQSLQVGEQFNQTSLNETGEPTNVESVIDGVIEAEEEAIKLYKEIIEEAKENTDYGTVNLAEELLREEEKHRQEFIELRNSLEE